MRTPAHRERALLARCLFRLLLLAFPGWLFFAGTLRAATYIVSNVNDSGAGSLRDAFTQAALDGESSAIIINVTSPILVGFSTGLPLPDPSDPFPLTITGNSAIIDGSALQIPGSGFTFTRGSVFVEGVTITNFPLHGIAIFGTVNGGTIQNSQFTNNIGSGIYLQGIGVQNLVISGNLFQGNHDDGVTILEGAHNHQVSGNQFLGNFTNGVKIASNATGNQVWNNLIQGNFQSGVLLTQGAVTNTIGPQNNIRLNELDGVQLDGVSTRNNLVISNSISQNNRDGVSLSLQTNQNTIQGNTITNNRVVGIEITNGVDQILIVSNTISGHGLVGGILVDGGTNIEIGSPGAGNTIRNNWLGIHVRGSSRNVMVRANTISANSSYGILVANSSQDVQILDGNELFSHTTYNFGPILSSGIRITGGQQITIQGSNIHDNFLGIYVSGGSNFYVNGITSASNQCSGLWVQSMIPPFQVANSRFLSNGFSAFFLPNPPPHFCSGVFHESPNFLFFGPNNEVANNVTGVNATGTLSNLAAITVASNGGAGIHNNLGAGIYLDLARGSVTNNTISANAGALGGGGVTILGGDFLVSGNSFVNHGIPHLYVSVHDGNTRDMSLSDLRDAAVRVLGNSFGTNSAQAAVLFREASAVNLVDLATPVGSGDQAGNTYTGVQNRFRQQWYGLIEPVNASGTPVTDAVCGWVEQGLEGQSNGRDLCPGIRFDDLSGRGFDFPNDYTLWALVDQVLIDGNGNPRLRFLNTPQTIYAYSGSATGTATYSWDGNTGNDPSRSPRPGFNQGGHYQVARVILRNPSSIAFITGSLWSEGIITSVNYAGIGTDTGVFVTDADIVNLASVTAEVENLSRGNRCTLTLNQVIDLQSGEVVGFAGRFWATDVTPANCPFLLGTQGEQVIARFWDPTDPARPLTYAVVPIVKRLPSTLDLLDPLTLQPLPKDQSTPPLTRVIVGNPLYLQLTDPDQNLDSNVTESYPNMISVSNQRSGEWEMVTVTETTGNSGIFRGILPTTTASSPASDGVIQALPGDRLLISYQDPDDPQDQSYLAVLVVLPPAPAALCLQDIYTSSCLSTLLADQVAIYYLEDRNRNLDPNFADTITAGIPPPGPAPQMMDQAGIGVASYSPSGSLLDWEIVGSYSAVASAYTIRETGNNTNAFAAKLFTSSLFGTNPLDQILYVVPGGSVTAFYVDHADPTVPPEKKVVSYPVTTTTQGWISYTDRYQHTRRYLYFSPQGFTEQGVLLYLPARNQDPLKVEELPVQALFLEGSSDLNDLIRYDSPPTPRETAPNSSSFYTSVGVFPSQGASQGDRNFNVRLGEVVQARYRDPQDPSLYVNTTAKLCKNVPAVLELRHQDGTLLSSPFPGERIQIILYDEDENQDWGQREVVQLTVSSLRSDDQEILNLVETDPASGVFSTELPLDDGGEAVPGDRRIRASGGEILTFLYQDRSFLPGDALGCPTTDEIRLRLTVVSPLRPSNLFFLDPQGHPTEDLDPAQPVRLRLVAPHLNRDLLTPEGATVEVFPDPFLMGKPQDPPQLLTLLETGADTGTFEEQVPPSLIASLSLGSWLTARYLNPADFADRVVTSAALLGAPLVVTITVTPNRGAPGDAVGVRTLIYNPNPLPTVPATLVLKPFRSLRPVKNTYEIQGERRTFPQPHSPIEVSLGTIAPRSLLRLEWAEVVAPGGKQGKDTMSAEVWANRLRLSPRQEVTFTVQDEPVFSRSTVFVQVFEDRNGNGFQEEGEPGIPGARVVSASGYSLYTDRYGRGHFADLPTGPERFKLDPRTLPQPVSFSTGDRVDLELKPGVLYQLSFGVVPHLERVHIPAEKVPWRLLTMKLDGYEIPVQGDLGKGSLRILGQEIPVYNPSVTFVGVRDPTALYASELTSQGGVNLRMETGGDPRGVTRAVLELSTKEGAQVKTLWEGKGAPPSSFFLKAQTLLPLLKPEQRYSLSLRLFTKEGEWSSRPYRFWFLRKPPLSHIQSAGYYGFNEGGLDPKTILLLSQAADLLRRYPHATVVIEGYTDDVGSPQYNLLLSQKRAEKAKEYLVLIEGIAPERIVARGRGATNFLYPNDTEEHRALNRRVEVFVSGIPLQEEELPGAGIRAGGKSLSLPEQGEFALFLPLASVSEPVQVMLPSGVSLRLPVTYPAFALALPRERWVFAPEFTAPVSLEAPRGTRLHYGGATYEVVDPPLRFSIPTYGKTVTEFILEFPEGKILKVRSLIVLEETSQPPPGQEALEPHTFLTVDVPPEGTVLRPGYMEIRGELPEGSELYAGTTPVPVEGGRFSLRLPVEQGPFVLDLAARHPLGLSARFYRTYSVEQGTFFGVGFLQHRTTLYRAREGEDFSQRWVHSGMAKLYLEDRFEGGSLKLRLRTPEEEWRLLPQDLKELEPGMMSIVDPHKTYPTYGDSSTTVEELPGALFLAMDLEYWQQRFMLGTLERNRSYSLLYSGNQRFTGGRLHLTSAPLLSSSTYTTDLDLTLSYEQSLFTVDRLASTGGLVYRLRQANVVEGSETITIEEQDPLTGIRYTVRELAYGKDYTIDYLSGTIWLFTPLELSGGSTTVIRDGTLTDRRKFLVVSYRYRPQLKLREWGHGETLVQRFAGEGEVGLNYEESVETGRTRTGLTWIQFAPTQGTDLHFEFGRRWGMLRTFGESADGGLNYWTTDSSLEPPANAFIATARTQQGPFLFDLYGRRMEAGFQGFRYSTLGTDNTVGLGVGWNPVEGVTAQVRGDYQRVELMSRSHSQWLQVQYPLGPFTVINEAKLRTTLEPQRNQRGDVGLGLRYPLSARLTLYGDHQQEVYEKGGDDRSFYRTTLGSQYQFSETLGGFVEGSKALGLYGGRVGARISGEKGDGALSYGVERDLFEQRNYGILGAQGGYRLSPTVRVRGGQEIRHNERELGYATLLGTDYQPLSRLTLGIEGERGEFPEGMNSWIRSAVRAKVQGELPETPPWVPAPLKIGLIAGIRWQKGATDSTGRSLESEVGSSPEKSFSVKFGFRYSRDDSEAGGGLLAFYEEFYLGGAYRPIFWDRLQVLGMLRYARELLPPRLDPTGTEIQAIIASLDTVYRLTRYLELGGKVSGKRSGVRWEGFVSAPVYTYLFIAHTALIFYHPFDLAGEYRFYLQPATRTRQHGPALEVGARPSPWLRFALGYQFVGFEDELRPHDRFDAEGIYLKVAGEL